MKQSLTHDFRAKSRQALQYTAALTGLIACILTLWTWLPGSLRYNLQCASSGLTPREELIKSPVIVGPEWTYFTIPSTLRRVPHPESFEINANPATHKLSEEIQGPTPSDLSIRRGLQNTKTGQTILFSVKVQDTQGREVRLFQHTVGVNHGLKPALPFLKFGLANQRWGKAYFAPDVQLSRVAIRASTSISIERLAWVPSGYCKWPNRTWDSAAPESRYHFEEGPGPASVELSD